MHNQCLKKNRCISVTCDLLLFWIATSCYISSIECIPSDVLLISLGHCHIFQRKGLYVRVFTPVILVFTCKVYMMQKKSKKNLQTH